MNTENPINPSPAEVPPPVVSAQLFETPPVVAPPAPPVPAEPEYLVTSEAGTHDLLISGRRFTRHEGGIYVLTEGDHTAVLSIANLQWHLRIDSVRPSGTQVISGRWHFPTKVGQPATLADRDQAFLTAIKYLDILVRQDRLAS